MVEYPVPRPLTHRLRPVRAASSEAVECPVRASGSPPPAPSLTRRQRPLASSSAKRILLFQLTPPTEQDLIAGKPGKIKLRDNLEFYTDVVVADPITGVPVRRRRTAFPKAVERWFSACIWL